MNSRCLILTTVMLLACGQASLLPAQEIPISRSAGVSTPASAPAEEEALKTLKLAAGLTGQNGPANILIVPSPQTPPQALVTLPEDMTVMSRILEKRLSQPYLSTADFRASDYISALGRNRTPTEAIFLEDYGVLFFIKVDVPLVPPPKTAEQADEQEQPTDPVWAETLKQLRNPELAAYRADKRPLPEYNAERVERLQQTALRTLKHAANIRALKPGDKIAVTLVYVPKGGMGQYLYRFRTQTGVPLRTFTTQADLGAPVALLTIRAAKPDVDAFAAGTLDLERFTKKVEILTSVAYLPSGSPTAAQSNPFQFR